MANCLVAQSGGPTAVINASLAGVIRANQLNPVYDRVYGGLHGIEGVLDDKLYDLTDLPGSEIEILKQSPSSALGTCRYKLKRGNDTDFKRLVEIMDKHDIEVMFYIGGNDSMDTVDALSEWAQEHGMPQRFVGIPKTVDNDLVPVDHCPGFPSAAKIANQIVHATYLDYAAYTRPEVFIVETMGRDAGWLAASCCVTGDVDLVVLPEVDFDKEAFLAEVKKKFDEKGECYIVVSEGAHYADGTYLSAGDTANDSARQLTNIAIFGCDCDRTDIYNYAFGYCINRPRPRCFVSVNIQIGAACRQCKRYNQYYKFFHCMFPLG